MTSFKKLGLLLTLGLLSIASNKALAAPVAVEQETGTVHGSNLKSVFSAVKNTETTRRDLEELARPVLQAAQPLADGVDKGATR